VRVPSFAHQASDFARQEEGLSDRDLRFRLQQMGPAAAAFGRFLAARVDLLPWHLCMALEQIPDYAEPQNPEMVHVLITRETGASPERAFLRFDPAPIESRLFWQSHAAQLAEFPVVVRVARTDSVVRMIDAESQRSIREELAARGVKESEFHGALAAFRREREAAATLEADLAAFAILARAGVAPEIHGYLSGRYVLVHGQYEAIPTGVPPSPEQAQSLALAWLTQALEGGVFPVEPVRGKLGIARDGRVVFAAGPFATLPEKRQGRFKEYLLAMAAQDPSRAYPHFVAAVESGEQSPNAELKRRFMQMAPFRDGFHARGDLPQFAEEVLTHWKIARECARPDESAITFFRGLFHLVRTTSSMAPGRDSLLEAIYELRVRSVFGQALSVFKPAEMAALMEQYATAFLRAPENLDRLLTGMASGESQGRESGRARLTSHARRGNGRVLLAALCAAVLLLQKLAASARSSAIEGVLAILLVAIGAAVLRMGSRGDE